MPFISLTQCWVNQPSIVELENLLSSQEALKEQMVGNKQSQPEVEVVFYTKDKGWAKCSFKRSGNDSNDSKVEGKLKGCFRCGEPGHIKRDC